MNICHESNHFFLFSHFFKNIMIIKAALINLFYDNQPIDFKNLTNLRKTNAQLHLKGFPYRFYAMVSPVFQPFVFPVYVWNRLSYKKSC